MPPSKKKPKKAKAGQRKKRPGLKELVEKNRGLSYRLADKFWENYEETFRNLAMDRQDLREFAFSEMALLAPEYDGRTEFSTFAWTGIENRLKEQLKKGRAAKRRHKPIRSLSEKIGESEGSLESTVEYKKRQPNQAELQEFRSLVIKAVNGLNIKPVQREWFFERFGLGGQPAKSFAEIAKRHNCLPSTVRMAVERIARKLRLRPEMEPFKDLLP